MRTDRELIKGSTQTLVLAILRDGPRLGYAIAREIEHRSTTDMKFKDGTLYPALQALEREGCILGTWEVVDNAPSRKVYTLTPHGQEELARRTGEWNQFTAMINRILNNEPQPQNS